MARENGPLASLFETHAFRWSDYDTPLWARRNSQAARWNEAGAESTQYWCLDPNAPWAELIRQESLRTESGLETVRQRLWIARWSVGPLADLASFEKAEAWGVEPEILVDDDHRRCRELALRLRMSGLAGVLCPSAALPFTTSLVIFGPRILVPWGSSPRLASSVPGALLAVGAPPPGLHERVRFRGERHAELEEYRRAKRARARGARRHEPPT